ncbi:MAG TPA: hypothetical protein VN729_07425 [Ktedonobacteraceae bacterium]|nr:hypothetical protein [Ktedonobacteraceae bacterium]
MQLDRRDIYPEAHIVFLVAIVDLALNPVDGIAIVIDVCCAGIAKPTYQNKRRIIPAARDANSEEITWLTNPAGFSSGEISVKNSPFIHIFTEQFH